MNHMSAPITTLKLVRLLQLQRSSAFQHHHSPHYSMKRRDTLNREKYIAQFWTDTPVNASGFHPVVRPTARAIPPIKESI